MAMVMCLFFNIIAKIHRKFGCFHKKEASLKMILRQRAFCGILEKSIAEVERIIKENQPVMA